MSIAARTETAEQRSAIYARLLERNRLVAVLRIGLPAIGAVIFAGLILQFYLGSLVPNFGFANITIDRGNLVIEAPSYSGVGTDGTLYTLTAAAAKTALGNTDLINLTSAVFDMKQTGGMTFEADAPTAQLQVSSQVVTVEGVTQIRASNGITGTIGNAVVDVPGETLVATGGADLAFEGGTTLKAASMSFDGATQRWGFTRVTLHVPETPGEAGAAPTTTEAVP